jgi:methylmalonyl-CoA epimerase
MVKSFDHVTIVVTDVEAAKRFFGLLGFREVQSVVISGHEMDEYMGVPGIEAEHVTLELTGSSPRNEVQLLRYRHPAPRPDPGIRDLTKLGFNHVCFAVDDLDAALTTLSARGFRLIHREAVPGADGKRVAFLHPEAGGGVLIELSEGPPPPDPEGRREAR